MLLFVIQVAHLKWDQPERRKEGIIELSSSDLGKDGPEKDEVESISANEDGGAAVTVALPGVPTKALPMAASSASSSVMPAVAFWRRRHPLLPLLVAE